MPISKKLVTDKLEKIKSTKNVGLRPVIIVNAGKTHAKDFLDFIRTQGVMGLAVGLVLGGAVSVLVKSLVDNVVMAPLGLLLGSAEGLKGLSWVIGKTANGKEAVLHYGIFLNDLTNFLVIALVVYVIVKLLKIEKISK